MVEMTIAAVRKILEDEKRSPHPERWSAQGFGMLRMYLDDAHVYRLNVWDDRLAVPGVSVIHDHPWHFESLIVSGWFGNIRYRQCGPKTRGALPYDYMTITTGEGGGPANAFIGRVFMYDRSHELYNPGDTYHQDADEVHESQPMRGCVTLNKRTPVSAVESHARVFWPAGLEWVDAMPRPATVAEIDMVLHGALEKWS